jgi:hypothetical protein
MVNQIKNIRVANATELHHSIAASLDAALNLLGMKDRVLGSLCETIGEVNMLEVGNAIMTGALIQWGRYARALSEAIKL